MRTICSIVNIQILPWPLLLVLGCHGGEPAPDVNPANYERYLVESSSYITTEYTTYRFLSDEQRTVYLGGNRGSEYELERVRAMNSFGDVKGGPEYLTDGNNSYLNQQGVWTMGLLVRAPWGQSGSSTYTFQLGKSDFSTVHSTSATIQLISNLNYAIEYSCMGSTYDLRSTGYAFTSKVTDAYSAAGTHFSIENVFSATIAEEDLPDIHTSAALLMWGDAHASGGAQHVPNAVVLFGMRDHIDGSRPYAWGVTGYEPSSQQPPRKAYAFVFAKRINDNLGGQDRQTAKTRIAIHELGHARGKDEYRAEMGDGILHDNKGLRQNDCVMLGAQWDPEKAFHFCEWHKQVLFNITWLP